MDKGISVIVCCYNSALRLPETIRHISLQIVESDIDWEVIIVNNTSADETTRVANEEFTKYNSITYKIVDQPIAGLSAARALGIEVSEFEYLIFCDDDNWLNHDYVRIAYESMEQHSDACIVGGQSDGYFDAPEPSWFELFSAAYVIEKPYDHSCYLPEERDYLAGAGLVIRKSVIKLLNELNFSPMLTDQIGKSLMSGGDYELCLITKFLGFRIFYNENLKITHYMPANRLNWNYCLKMITYGHAIPEIYFRTYKVLFSRMNQSFPFSYNKHFVRLFIDYTKDIIKPEKNNINGLSQILFQIKYFFITSPGSMDQKRILSAKNKLIYLFLNKNKFKEQVNKMKDLIEKIERYKEMNCDLEKIKIESQIC